MPRRDPICPVCELIIESGRLVSFQQGELLHLRCYEALRLGLTTKPPTRAPRREEPQPDDESARG